MYKLACSVFDTISRYSPWLERCERDQIRPSVGAQSLSSGQVLRGACAADLAVWVLGVAAHVVQRDEVLRLAVDARSLQREARAVVSREEGSVELDTDDLTRPPELDNAPVLPRVRASEV